MDELDRINLEMALNGLMAEIGHIESKAHDLLPEDRKQIQMAMARLNSVLSEKRAAA
jgi:regulator of replication initiation timing